MEIERFEEIIERERAVGRAPVWLLDSLEKAKESMVEAAGQEADKQDDDFPEFIYPH